MARFYAHTLILPDNTHLDNFIIEVSPQGVLYYPFMGEIHSTIYIDKIILCSYRADLNDKTIALNQLEWALGTASNKAELYVYTLTPCASCTSERYIATKL